MIESTTRFPPDAYVTVRYHPKADMWLTVVAVRGNTIDAYAHAERSDAFDLAIKGAAFHGLECLVKRGAA